MSKCKHRWQFSTTRFEYPDTGSAISSLATEYAYTVCRGCGLVKKTKVQAV